MSLDYLKATFGLEGYTALITGAGTGLGYAIAYSLGNAGARIIVNDLSLATCEEAVAKLRILGIESRAASFDVSNAAAVQDACSQLAAEGWHVNILVSNAGNQNRMPVIEQTTEAWQSLFNVHVNGAFNCTRAVLPHMMAEGHGRIILISSVAALASMPGISAYSASKGALAAFTRSLAVEYGEHGITCNALAPGFVKTNFTAALQQREQFNDFVLDSVPLRRWAQPEDIAPATVYLASQAGSFVNGHLLTIDGGLLARM
ncbi:MAG: SDR family NAD(P)-dependent oxidoreductase [Advenella sp.]|uniref:Short-chain dehydrogenase n=1 Tax=Advenella kashmirensis TaxID=310575 RepID=A0A356LC20_9BURK|nr:SDR family oxidoreductase [Advenella sp. FME57]HBP28546.1 short-chain dehydrogenase [Advenella kashmirensis]